MSEPSVLIFGGSGQVGSELRRAFAGWFMTVTRSQPTPGWVTCDLANESAVRETIRTAAPQVIVNAAAYTAVDKAEDDFDQACRINGDAAKTMAEEAERAGAVLIHFSTDYVYDGRGEAPFREDDPPAPINAYGASKLRGDEGIMTQTTAGFIFRTSWVFGAHGPNFVKTMLRLAQERDELGVVDDQIGAPTSAATLAKVTRQLAALGVRGSRSWLEEHSGIYHVTSRGATSWYGFADEIIRIARDEGMEFTLARLRPITSEDFPRPARRPRNSRLDLTKINHLLGDILPHWKDALRRDFFAHPLAPHRNP